MTLAAILLIYPPRCAITNHRQLFRPLWRLGSPLFCYFHINAHAYPSYACHSALLLFWEQSTTRRHNQVTPIMRIRISINTSPWRTPKAPNTQISILIAKMIDRRCATLYGGAKVTGLSGHHLGDDASITAKLLHVCLQHLSTILSSCRSEEGFLVLLTRFRWKGTFEKVQIFGGKGACRSFFSGSRSDSKKCLV